MIKEPVYLGDSVYMSASHDGGVVLTTGNHQIAEAYDVIHLDPYVLTNMIQIIEKAMEQQK